MTQVLQGIAGVVYFIDDILITGRTREEHEKIKSQTSLEQAPAVWPEVEQVKVPLLSA